jgi:CDP-paratose 2-epimerase
VGPERDRVVITGGAGFIGSNLADRLAAAGEAVLILDNLSRAGAERNLEWLASRHPQIDVEIADVRDARKVWQVVRRAKTVFHLAAQVAVTRSLGDPVEDFQVNALGTLNVLEAARSASAPPAVLYASTNKVYGELPEVAVEMNGTRYRFAGGRTGIGEDARLDFQSPYGCSKGTGDQYVLDYARVYRVPTCVFRMSCIYGPRQFGTEDQGWVAHFAISALAGRRVTLYGDGSQVRDILYVDDLLDALLVGAEHARRVPGRVFNIGGGAGNAVSVLDLLDLLAAATGRMVRREHAGWRPGDQRIFVTDTTRAQRELRWAPRTGNADGIRRLVDWLRAEALARPGLGGRLVGHGLTA